MIPVTFPQANARFGPPPELDGSQCLTIPAYLGKVAGGSLDGSDVVVVAWKPSPDEIELLKAGQPILLSSVGGLTPHFLTLDFEKAIRPS
ncbi:MAG TPA: hypothetical protein VG347_05150 [Verrucomicrobiae bacterium]|nr:hypothetical protein [Verrucomicrobiae bacterium]